jgi:hypothetical protein
MFVVVVVVSALFAVALCMRALMLGTYQCSLALFRGVHEQSRLNESDECAYNQNMSVMSQREK